MSHDVRVLERMTKEEIGVNSIIVVAVILLCVATHLLARWVSARWPIAVPNSGSTMRPTMGKRLRYVIGIFCLFFGGIWCIGLFFARVDPPEVGSANMSAVIAAGIVAAGINLIGKGMVAGSQNENKKKSIVLGLALAAWLSISAGLAAWHRTILHIRKTRAGEAVKRIQKEVLKPSSEPLLSAPVGLPDGMP